MEMNLKIAVIGAGVVGLSSALCLAQHFPASQLSVIASEFYPNRQENTSVHGFGMLTHRFDSPNTNKNVVAWLLKTKEYCSKMHPTVAESAGIRPVDTALVYYAKDEKGLNTIMSENARCLQNYKNITERKATLPLSQDDTLKTLFTPLEGGGDLFAFETSTYVVDSSLYLPWLKNELASLKTRSVHKR
uniref:D-aspartate oxidase n=1 Tax=Phallusia mammillata TaxID=59560 RepID=A0A6F9DA40_9ASCI|nr:D-aspartate oxidase-like [Phallusia mammillata]